ncbi:DdrH [Deinococcus sp. Marseille-Q6407]|uniref:DdrH n=1 Tax=Deinococcus sp. Marseille-Q6407 TaxID=2969223 RepID=UPI0021C25453|nr:DdrH [Deinococcus sp. Marseille-Q6407]
MSNAYAEWFAQVEKDYGDQLSEMTLPDGLPEHLADLMEAGDQEAVLFMLKVAWQLGAQAGLSAGVRLAKHGQLPQRDTSPSSGLKA